ncbi:MAG: VCBS repeat-containing protein, partial [Ignavibacteria bacterium]|nr:VCBS repeat-containing protein [Ignavibacteria bacterium]
MRLFVVSACLLLLISFSETVANAQQLQVKDIALKMNFQDTTFGHYKRGRASVAADFNLDGYVDFYIGNPGDESFVLESVPAGGNGTRRFALHTLPLDGRLTWGAVSFDYDNDGDYDLFIAVGGSEGIGFDVLFRNEWLETGVLQFTDVSESAGIRGLVPDGETDPIMSASANAVTADYDLDGDTDLFVNGNKKTIPGYGQYEGRNTLWRNNGDGTFTDVTVGAGLGDYLHATRHSTFFDFDNDGDPDLYENNFFGCNILWRNNGDGTFTDVTLEMSGPGEDLTDPTSSFATASADFNNDGWEDLIVFMRGRGRPEGRRITGICDCSGCGDEFPFENVDCDGYDQYPMGHALFMNQQGTGFVNVADIAGINDDYVET